MRVLVSIVLAVAACGIGLPAQERSEPTFEAASVKRTAGTPGALPFPVLRGNRFVAEFSTVRELIQTAYAMEPHQVIGGPGWIDVDHFEVNATIAPGTSVADAAPMLRRLLNERFGLVVHHATQDLSVFVLTAGERLGPQLLPASVDGDCRPPRGPIPPPDADRRAFAAPAPPPPPPPSPPNAGPRPVPIDERPSLACPSMFFRGHISARRVTLAAVVWNLTRLVGRPVIDRTGLSGSYDLDLSWLPDSGPMRVNGIEVNADGPSLSTAIREQLGLRLDTTRAPLDVVIIERVSPPTEN